MAQDVKIDCESGKFKFRVVGILRYKDRFLVQKIQNNTEALLLYVEDMERRMETLKKLYEEVIKRKSKKD